MRLYTPTKSDRFRSASNSRYDISLLGDREAIKEKLGTSYWQAKDLEDDPDAPRTHFVSEEAIGELQGALGGGFFFLGHISPWQPC